MQSHAACAPQACIVLASALTIFRYILRPLLIRCLLHNFTLGGVAQHSVCVKAVDAPI
jgi:hypothetical protein